MDSETTIDNDFDDERDARSQGFVERIFRGVGKRTVEVFRGEKSNVGRQERIHSAILKRETVEVHSARDGFFHIMLLKQDSRFRWWWDNIFLTMLTVFVALYIPCNVGFELTMSVWFEVRRGGVAGFVYVELYRHTVNKTLPLPQLSPSPRSFRSGFSGQLICFI